jgi:centlein
VYLTALISQLTELKTESQLLSTCLTDERNSHAQEIQSTNQVMSDVQATCQKLEGKNRELKKDCQMSREKINELTEVVRRLKLEDEHKNSQLSELRSIVVEAERISNECRIALEVEKELHRKSLQKLDETKKQGQAAYSELQQALQEIHQNHAKELSEKARENEKLKAQLMGGDGVHRETQTDEYKDELRDSSTSPLKISQLPISTPPSTLQFERQMTDMQAELENTKEKLKVKMQELREVKSAHVNRLKRLQDLQMNYRLVLEQLKTYEEGDLVQSPACLNFEAKGPLRASVKELQQEDSDTVWNELCHYKTQNRALQAKRVALEEECDVLRVRVAEQLGTIHDLVDCLKTEKDGTCMSLSKHASACLPACLIL